MLSAAAGVPVSVMKTAESGGPYGMALLAAYMLRRDEGESLPDYLDNRVFAGAESTTLMASEEEIAGFDAFLKRYLAAFPAEKAAIETLR
jgi:sugar (pentulose or hexulose) kinase